MVRHPFRRSLRRGSWTPSALFGPGCGHHCRLVRPEFHCGGADRVAAPVGEGVDTPQASTLILLPIVAYASSTDATVEYVGVFWMPMNSVASILQGSCRNRRCAKLAADHRSDVRWHCRTGSRWHRDRAARPPSRLTSTTMLVCHSFRPVATSCHVTATTRPSDDNGLLTSGARAPTRVKGS